MIVKELIEKLKQFPQEKTIEIHNISSEDDYEIKDVWTTSYGSILIDIEIED